MCSLAEKADPAAEGALGYPSGLWNPRMSGPTKTEKRFLGFVVDEARCTTQRLSIP
jgi:hypothetical protein